ncbi:MAG: hypothetical protein IT283_06810, partial [Bacteroidetes bacterium]|nr:hypothetical protein [Bacteroidota bacterium]
RHDTIIYTVNNVTCTTIVNYCYRTVGLVAPFTEIFLCGAVYIPSGCAGFNNWDYREIDKFITEEIIKQNKGGVFPPCPVCPWVEPNYRTYYIGCKNGEINCDNTHAFCVISYTLCCKDGEAILTEQGRSFQGTCPDGCLPDSCYWP